MRKQISNQCLSPQVTIPQTPSKQAKHPSNNMRTETYNTNLTDVKVPTFHQVVNWSFQYNPSPQIHSKIQTPQTIHNPKIPLTVKPTNLPETQISLTNQHPSSRVTIIPKPNSSYIKYSNPKRQSQNSKHRKTNTEHSENTKPRKHNPRKPEVQGTQELSV